MKILVNGKEAVLKAGSSFEYVSENPLFTEAEDYSLEIEFPLKDCPQNILIFGALHVKGVDISKVSFPCEIVTESFDKTGFLAITEVNDAVVKGQFLEGMSTGMFDSDALKLYIDELDYSDYDGTDGTQASVSRVSGAGWKKLAVWDSDLDKWACNVSEIRNYSAGYPHIHLYKLMEVVADICNISLDKSELDALPVFSKVLIANSTNNIALVSGQNYMNLEKTLPHWTVREFFEEVGKFFLSIPLFDSLNGTVKYQRLEKYGKSSSYIRKVNQEVLDEFSVEVVDGESSRYGKLSKIKMPDETNQGNLNMCPGFIALAGPPAYDLIEPYGGSPTKAAKGDWSYAVGERYRHGSRRVYITEVEKRQDRSDFEDEYFVKFDVLNQYGNMKEGEEVRIVPAQLGFVQIKGRGVLSEKWYKINTDVVFVESESDYANFYKVPMLPANRITNEWATTGVPSVSGYVASSVLSSDGLQEYKYDKLYIVIHSGTTDEHGYHINTRLYEQEVGTEYLQETLAACEGLPPIYYKDVMEYQYMLCPSDSCIASSSDLPPVDESKLYRYKFLSKTLPDPKAVYVIKGKEYACLRLTAHFTVDGMSELIGGEFYEIVG